MTRLLASTLLAFATLALAAQPARATGYYFGVGMGDGAELQDDLALAFDTRDQISGRVVLGRRVGPWALEGSFFGTDMEGTYDGVPYSTLSLGIGVKYYLPLTGRLELYVRGGLNQTTVAAGPGYEYAGATADGLNGRGYDYGTGLQYAWRPLPRIQMSVWVDLNRQVLRLNREAGGDSLDGRMEMVTFGFSFGTEL